MHACLKYRSSSRCNQHACRMQVLLSRMQVASTIVKGTRSREGPVLKQPDLVPPQTWASANKSIVGGFAQLDVRLEQAGVLPELEAPEHPDEVTDEDGRLTDDVNEARPGFCACRTSVAPALHASQQQLHGRFALDACAVPLLLAEV